MPIHKPFLHELLNEDQEPFHLKNYIAHQRSQLNKSPRPEFEPLLQIKRNPIIEASSKSKLRSLCKHGCFLPFQDSPVVTKSKTSDFIESQSKSPTTTRTGSVCLHIPARTSALLLEAANRIQKHKGHSIGIGLFSSVLKKLIKDTYRRRNQENEIRNVEDNKSQSSDTKIEINGDHSNERRSSNDEVGFSSGGLSENNEEGRRSLDVETSTSSWRSENSGEIDFVAQETENREFSPSGKRFWSSPSRFSSKKSFYSGRGSPSLSSPASSPSQRKENKQVNCSRNIKKEGKEQSSPVSVLETPFDNEDVEEDHHKDYDVELQCSFAFVERAKEQLLNKLRRFELLANLDPVELEKRMMEQLNEEENENEYYHVVESKSQVVFKEMKNKTKWLKKGSILFNTIDMMVQCDLENEWNMWKICQVQREENAMQIELSIFGHLVEEMAEILMESSNHEKIVFLPSE